MILGFSKAEIVRGVVVVDENMLIHSLVAMSDYDRRRRAYAEWLEQRRDPRAKLLREYWDVPFLSLVDDVAQCSSLEYYLKTFPELREHVVEHEANRWRRNYVAALGSGVERDWLAIIDTLGRPFRPFTFWNNTGPNTFPPDELPLGERLGTRGALVTFASAFRGRMFWNPGVAADLSFLYRLRLNFRASGAAWCPVHPFLCELPPSTAPLRGSDVLRALHASEFRSDHIANLDACSIPYPGYHPNEGYNDEIHTDPLEQYLFEHLRNIPPASIEWTAGALDIVMTHEQLRDHVVDRQLWYVLLHSRRGLPSDPFERRPWGLLFAVGRSLHGNRLLGVVSHQMCHDFCD